jgi:hypothetical protein
MDETLLTIAVNEDCNAPLFKPLAVNDSVQTVAAAVFVERRGAVAFGFVLDATITAPIGAGFTIVSHTERSQP